MIFSTAGKVVITIGVLLLLPLITAMIFGEWNCVFRIRRNHGGSFDCRRGYVFFP